MCGKIVKILKTDLQVCTVLRTKDKVVKTRVTVQMARAAKLTGFLFLNQRKLMITVIDHATLERFFPVMCLFIRLRGTFFFF